MLNLKTTSRKKTKTNPKLNHPEPEQDMMDYKPSTSLNFQGNDARQTLINQKELTDGKP